MFSFPLRAFAAASLAAFALVSSARAQCEGCTADANPTFVDSGAVASCGGGVQLRMTITPDDGECVVDQFGYCIQIDDCDFWVDVEYRARSCSTGAATFGKTGCNTVFPFFLTYPMSWPGWSGVTNGNVSRDCDTQCQLTFFGQCENCTTGTAQVTSTLTCTPCETP